MEVVVEKNKHYQVTISDLGESGEGIGKVDGYTLFIPGALVGDVVEVCVTKTKKNFGFAKVVRQITPSPNRQTPPCILEGTCGGCQIQGLSYEAQLAFKQSKVESCLKRIGGLENIKVSPIIGMKEPSRYRNKAQYPIRKEKGEIKIGFFSEKSHEVVAITDCLLQPSYHQVIIQKVKQFLETYPISIYDEQSHRGLVKHLMIKGGNNGEEVMVCLVINGKNLPHSEELVASLKRLPEVKSIVLNHHEAKSQVILGDACTVLYGVPYIMDRIGDLKFKISPMAFFQVNPVQTQILYEKALAFADLKGDEIVWDAYCGIGSISLFLAQKAKHVYGVEIIPEAIEDAKANALLNGLDNTTFYAGKAEEVIPRLYEEEGIKADVIVVDPPRKGCDEQLLTTICKMAPQKVVYVSCNPATLARDLAYLTKEAGYKVEVVQPVDMFGHTTHVETVCLLSKLHEVKHHVNVTLDMDELDVTSAESKATYEEIKDYVLDKHGLQVTNLYIAQVKRKCGIIERENYNKSQKEDAKQPQCPEDKEKAIMDALEHFGMV